MIEEKDPKGGSNELDVDSDEHDTNSLAENVTLDGIEWNWILIVYYLYTCRYNPPHEEFRCR